ncbi:BTAD domain-containing putative transcriptional regulator [Streptomyces sp. NPDC056749]|uniref:AfsR/SARP family transcriptional regulator n=1 Tax=Streptomyces sp. NPDC056749 TaxID=3345936 RepID=UPI0036B514E2
MEEHLRFAVLGPVRVWRGPNEIEVGPPQQRSVLAVLLLAEGSQVSASRLIDAVWGHRAPASALGILRTYVHHLRKSLEPAGSTTASLLRSTGDGYQLCISPQELDLGIFRELLALAERTRGMHDVAGAAGHLRDALRLWEGAALAGVRGDWAQTQRQRLGELRLAAQVARSEIEIERGRLAEAVAHLTGLVAEYPLDERLRELLMLSLYRSERQSAALDTYREVQALLADELGVDPGPALQAMYQRILRADAELLALSVPVDPAPATVSVPDRASAIPSQLPAALPVFVGRDAEWAEVAELSSGGTVVVSAIAGMAGVGKTAFAVHWARQVAHRFPDGQLFLNLRGFDLVGLPVSPEHALRTLLESLGTDTRGLPQDADALAALYRSRLSGKRMLVLLDNARDAAQVRPLLPGAPGCLVIVTSRNRLAGLVAVDGAHPLNLAVLSVPEARALLARRLGHGRVAAEPEAVEEIIAHCARLPLALAVTAARAAIRSSFPLTVIADELREQAGGLDAFQDSDTAADVRVAFSWSYSALTPDAARLFRLLALHPGPDIALPAAASLAGLTVVRTRQLLFELTQAHLVNEAVPNRYAFHDLLRAYATELTGAVEAPESARAARHRMFDHYLHSAHAAAALISRARALITLAPAVEGVGAEGFAKDAAKAAAWLAAEQTVLFAVIQQAVTHRYDVHTWQIAWTMSSHLHMRGLWREQEATCLAGMDAAVRLGNKEALANAHHSLSIAASGLGRNQEARDRVERAIELFTESGDRRNLPEAYRTLAWVAEQQGDLKAALGAAQRALVLHQAHDGRDADENRNRMAVAVALNAVGWCHTLLGQNQHALHHCQQALALHQELGEDTNTAHSWDSIGHAHHQLGHYEQAVTAFHNALDLYRQYGHLPWFAAGTLSRLGDTHLSAGCPDEARAMWVEALEIAERIDHPDSESFRSRLRQLDESSSFSEVAIQRSNL